MRKLLLTLSLLAASTLPAAAADNSLAGTWKLDPSRSHYEGSTFTYTQLPNGMMHYSDGAIAFDFLADGQERPTVLGESMSVNGKDANHWTSITKLNGKLEGTSEHSISADGKTLTVEFKGTKPDGSHIDDTTIYTRVSGSQGAVGKWKSTKVTVSSPGTSIITFEPGEMIRWAIPDYKEEILTRLGGPATHVTGENVAADLLISIKKVSDHKLSYAILMGSKTIGLGEFTSSADGKTATDVSWTPGKESEKGTGFYVKQ